MKSPYVCIIALAIAVVMLSMPATALPVLSVPYLRAGPCYYINASEVADLIIFEFNSSHLVAEDSEALAISFMPAGIAGGLTIAPAIAQASSRTIACDQTYFFRDFSGIGNQ